jgi:hypothetical protein
MSTCNICCEKFNAGTRKKVNCLFCDFEACRACVQTYCQSTAAAKDPHCMQCKNAWNREFMDAACSKAFCKNHRETVLFEREKSLLPATQPFVRRVREIEARTRQRDQALAELRAAPRHENARARRTVLAELVRRLEEHLRVLEDGHERGIAPEQAAPAQAQPAAVGRRCPCGGCRGFLSSDTWKCGVCEKKTCSACNEEEENDGTHVCNPESVETAKLLKTDTKSCPKCGVLIFRESGCAQMWCPDCHAVFNWNTLEIDTGIIHNPHYYEFQVANARTQYANAGRNLGDIPCGGFPTITELLDATERVGGGGGGEARRAIANIHMLVAHIQNDELALGAYRDIDQAVNNLDLRIKYLMNEMDENEFRVAAQKREKARSKNRDVANILRMFVDTASDIMRQVVLDGEILPHLDILNNLIRYTNETFAHIHKRYGCATPRINERAQLVKENYKTKSQK